MNQLFKVASLNDQKEQRAAFAQLLAAAPKPSRRLQSLASNADKQRVKPSQRSQVRAVAYFNPQIFARQRWLAQSALVELAAQVLKLNQRLANPRSQLQPQGALQAVEDWLRHRDLLSVFGAAQKLLHYPLTP